MIICYESSNYKLCTPKAIQYIGKKKLNAFIRLTALNVL